MNKTLNNIAEKIKNLELKFQYIIFGGLLFFAFLINYLLVMQFEIGMIKKMNDNQLTIKN